MEEQKFIKKGATLFVVEDGKKYRIRYHMMNREIFSNLDKNELVDVSHSAKLQYRLLLLDPVIKATVDFNELKIVVVYNPDSADNNNAKMSMEKLVEFLAQEGVHVRQVGTKNEDYDYYTQLYSYAYASPSIRKSAPWSYTIAEWERHEPAFIKKSKKREKEKIAKFRAWQNTYLKHMPNY